MLSSPIAQSVRHAEFGHAVLDRLLDTTVRRPPLYYVGIMRDDQRDCAASMEGKVYDQWDASDAAPPKRRPVPVETLSDPSLELLGWSNGSPFFPESLMSKFAEGSAAHGQVVAMKKELVDAFPEAARQATQRQLGSTSNRPTVRAGGSPDYSIDGGACPLDTTRMLEKEHVSQTSFNVTRFAFFLARKVK